MTGAQQGCFAFAYLPVLGDLVNFVVEQVATTPANRGGQMSLTFPLSDPRCH